MKQLIGKAKPSDNNQRSILFFQYLAFSKAKKYACEKLLEGIAPRYILNDIKSLFLPATSYAIQAMNSARMLLDPLDGYLDIYIKYLEEKLYCNEAHSDIFLPKEWWQQEFNFYSNIDNSQILNINFKETDDLIQLLSSDDKFVQIVYKHKEKKFKVGLNISFLEVKENSYAEFDLEFDRCDYEFLNRYFQEKSTFKNMPFSNIEALWYEYDLYTMINLDDSLVNEKEVFALIQDKNKISQFSRAAASAIGIMMLGGSFVPSNALTQINNDSDITLAALQPSPAVSFEPSMFPPTMPPSSQNSPLPTAEPSLEPSLAPPTLPPSAQTPKATIEPTVKPTIKPVVKATVKPTIKPVVHASVKPTIKPAVHASVKPTIKPAVHASVKPSVKPTVKPSVKPVVKATVKPTIKPAVQATVKPTIKPAVQATVKPTIKPSVQATVKPTIKPSVQATVKPSVKPVIKPTVKPTQHVKKVSKKTPQTSQSVTNNNNGKNGFNASYVVSKGDTLYSISKNVLGHGKHWKKLYRANKHQLKRANCIYPGQELILPTIHPEKVQTVKTVKSVGGKGLYVVKKGDSLYRIAAKNLGKGSKWTKLYRLNRNKLKRSLLIYPGQVLRLQ